MQFHSLTAGCFREADLVGGRKTDLHAVIYGTGLSDPDKEQCELLRSHPRRASHMTAIKKCLDSAILRADETRQSLFREYDHPVAISASVSHAL